MELLQEFSIPLIAGVVVALVWANIDLSSYHDFIHWSPTGESCSADGHHTHYNFYFLVNDLFMVLFFGVAAKEITEACLPGGALNPVRKAINPILGTLGGVVGPAGFYLLWVKLTGDASIQRGWAIPTATDIALAWLVARMAFGSGHPAVSFLLLLAVADDGIGLAIIAIFYPTEEPRPLFLLVIVAGMVIAGLLRKRKVTSFWPYLLGPGVLSWLGLYLSHLHPALALVPIVPFLPASGHDDGLYAEETAGHPHSDTLNAFEHSFKTPVDIGLFAFGLANAGVAFSSMGNATWGVLLGLVLGKSLGVFLFSWVGCLVGFSLPTGMNLRTLLLAGMTAGLGLTVALFVAGVAFVDLPPDLAPTITGAAKMGALFSAGMAPLVLLGAWLLRVEKVRSKGGG